MSVAPPGIAKKAAKKAAAAAASETYVPGDPCTFMGFDSNVLPLYEYSFGDRFPAYRRLRSSKKRTSTKKNDLFRRQETPFFFSLLGVVVVDSAGPRIVAGVGISVPPSTGEAEQQQQQPSGGGAAQAGGGSRKGRGDLKKRKRKTCKRCKEHGDDSSTTFMTCKGRAPNGTCEYWTAEGKAVAKRKR